MSGAPESAPVTSVRGVAVVSAAAGFLAIFLPWLLAGSPKNLIDGFQPISFLFLLLVGVAFGIAAPGHAWVVGLSSVALLPVLALVQAIADPSSHNLLGIEFVFYGFLAIPATVGAVIGKGLGRLGRPHK